jgi:NADH-quinone oxidoreductase subunit G
MAHRSAILAELANFQQANPGITLNILEGRGNSMGARFAGMRPDLGPIDKHMERPGLNAIQIIETAAIHGWDFLYVAGSNPAMKFPKKLWKDARAKLKFLVVQDLFLTETARQADLVLPALSFVEKGGTFLNIEGRVQSLLPGKEISEAIRSDGEIFQQIADKLGFKLDIETDFAKTLKVGSIVVKRSSRQITIKPTIQNHPENVLLATFAHVLFDQGVRMKHDPHVSQLTKEPRVRLNPLDAFKLNIANGNRISVQTKEHGIMGVAKLDDKVAPGTVVLPLGFDDFPVQNLGTNLLNGLPVELINAYLAEENSYAF